MYLELLNIYIPGFWFAYINGFLLVFPVMMFTGKSPPSPPAFATALSTYSLFTSCVSSVGVTDDSGKVL